MGKFIDLSEAERKLEARYFIHLMNQSNNIGDLKRTVKLFTLDYTEMFHDPEYGHSLRLTLRKRIEYLHRCNVNQCLFQDNPFIVNQGIRCDDKYGESWTMWYLFSVDTVEQAEHLIRNSTNHNIYIEADTFHSAYDCTGRMFSHEMDIIRVGKNRVLATKWHGLDV